MKDATRYLCIRCWRIIERSNARGRCGQCNTRQVPWAGGEPAWIRVRDLRPLEDEEGELRCRHHPDSRLRLACECGELLSPRAQLSGLEPVGLGFAGPFSAGKTLLLSSMVSALYGMKLLSGLWSLHGVWDTDQRFARLTEKLRRGEKVGTPPEDLGSREDKNQAQERVSSKGRDKASAGERNFCWQLLAGGEGGRSAGSLGLVAVYDLAGEDWGRLPQLHEPKLESFLRYLRLLRSLVFVLDGAVIARDLGLEVKDAWARPARSRASQQNPRVQLGDGGGEDRHVLGAIMERLGEGCRKVDVALTVSKMDLLWDHEPWRELGPVSLGQLGKERYRELVEEILSRSGRDGLVLAARRSFRSVDLFATSGLGFRPTPELVLNGRLQRPPAPVGVGEPLLWLLGKARERTTAERSRPSGEGDERLSPPPAQLRDLPLFPERVMSRPATATNRPAAAGTKGDMKPAIRVFISHSHVDLLFAQRVIALLRSAMPLPSEAIRATSVDGFRLRAGAHTAAQLRDEVVGAEAFIALISKSSVRSAYVSFEMGARWGSGKALIPLLAAGFDPRSLEGPLKEYNLLSSGEESQVFDFVEDVARTLGLTLDRPQVYSRLVGDIVQLGRRQEEPMIIVDERSVFMVPRETGVADLRSLLQLGQDPICVDGPELGPEARLVPGTRYSTVLTPRRARP